MGGGRTNPVVVLATTMSLCLYVAPFVAFMGESDVKPGFGLGRWGDNKVV